MSYSVTGIRSTPDIGFRSGHRHTAEGARDLATSFAAEGLQEIEVRDDRGDLRTLADLETEARDHGDDQRGIVYRLSALT